MTWAKIRQAVLLVASVSFFVVGGLCLYTAVWGFFNAPEETTGIFNAVFAGLAFLGFGALLACASRETSGSDQ